MVLSRRIGQQWLRRAIIAGAICCLALVSPFARHQTHDADATDKIRPVTSGPPERFAATPSLNGRRAPLPGPYAVEVVRVVDGDTFEARVRVWFGQEVDTLVRIRGIDAPELKARCPQELQGATAARDMLTDLLSLGVVTLDDVGPDKYFGRVLANVRIRRGPASAEDVAAILLAGGLARPYDGGHRAGWCPVIARTQ